MTKYILSLQDEIQRRADLSTARERELYEELQQQRAHISIEEA